MYIIGLITHVMVCRKENTKLFLYGGKKALQIPLLFSVFSFRSHRFLEELPSVSPTRDTGFLIQDAFLKRR